MITVNERHQIAWRPGLTVKAIIREMKYSYPHVVVTVNGTLVKHDAYAETTVPDQADVRVVHLMAGG